MKLLLHIGTEKTGTTALQAWLRDNREALKAHGVWVAGWFRSIAAVEFAVMARDPAHPTEEFGPLGLETPADHAAFLEDRKQKLARDVAAARAEGATTYIISCEHLHSRLPRPGEVARVREIVAPHFDDVEVHCFLRPQVEMAISLASTGSRVGLAIRKNFFDTVRPKAPYYDYAALLSRWSAAFGAENVHPVPFRVQPRPVAHVCGRLGLDEGALPNPERRVNSALDYRTVALMNDLVRAQREATGSEKLPPLFRNICQETMSVQHKLTLGRADAEEVHARFAEQNRALAADWPQLSEENLTPDWSRFDAEGTFDLLEGADYAPKMLELIGRLNQTIQFQRGRIARLESELAERDGRADHALRAQNWAVGHFNAAVDAPFTPDWLTGQHKDQKRRLRKLQQDRAAAAGGKPARRKAKG